ncbi:DNA polymerase alpha subunit B N-terminal-domain-containing protein [Bisporella sp. PMI_857]|nr:DNA polymerase alpha subunit B N-terminal-domain-containing protein [Bisporella sp. PMI_857]
MGEASIDSELKERFASVNAEIEPDYEMGSDDMKLNIDTARTFKEHIQDELERENRSKAHVLSSNKRGGATPRSANTGDVFGMLDSLVPNTPRVGSASRINGTAKRRPHETPSVSRAKICRAAFNDRENAGVEVEVLNHHLQIAEPPIAPYPQPRIRLVANSDIKKLSYKPMAMKLSEASEILDDRIDEFMGLFQEHHKLDDSQFGSAASKGISEIIAVGRIASDSLEGKLNTSSLVLETSRRMGGVTTSAPSALEAHIQRLRSDPDAMDDGSDPAPLSILLGAGPYSADDNLDFEPFHVLCSQAADTYADALILTGPFIDIDHPLIASGDFDLPEEAMAEPDSITMSTVFKYLISPALNQLVASNPHITIILVPSVKDAISKHVSWPQEPFSKQALGLHKNVKIIGNPMILSLNEISIGISSLDVFSHLRNEEVLGSQPKDNILARLPKYLFKAWRMVNVRPDLMIIPSAMPPFAKIVESVVVVNPGYLSKRRRGTYSRLTIHPYSMSEEERDSKTMIVIRFLREHVWIF